MQDARDETHAMQTTRRKSKPREFALVDRSVAASTIGVLAAVAGYALRRSARSSEDQDTQYALFAASSMTSDVRVEDEAEQGGLRVISGGYRPLTSFGTTITTSCA